MIHSISRLRLTAALLLIGIGYLALSPHFPVGYFNDDACYINLSRALATTHQLADLRLPGHPLNTDRLPGYPIFLLPWSVLVAPAWWWLKLSSILLSLGSLALFWDFTAPYLDSPARKTGILFMALQPTFIRFSCSVMAEPLFLCVVLAVWVATREAVNGRRSAAWGLVFLIPSATWIRPEGILLVFCVAPLLWMHRHRGLALACAGAWAAALALIGLRNLVHSHTPSGYWAQWHQYSVLLFHGWALPRNIWNVFHVCLVDMLLHATISNAWIRSAAILCLLAVLGYGFVRSLRQSFGVDKHILIGAGFFVVLVLALHSLFPAVTTRYFFACIPFMLLWLIKAAETSRSRIGRVAAAAILLGLYSNPASTATDQLSRAYMIPIDTYGTIRSLTPPDAFVLSIASDTTYLYTDRYSTSIIESPDIEAFRYSLFRRSVAYILLAPARLMTLPSVDFIRMNALWQKPALWRSAWPSGFQTVYQNAEEKTEFIQVISDPSYMKAYDAYLEARQAFHEGRQRFGMDLLAKALRLQPTLTSALCLSGTAYLYGEGNPQKAAAQFEKALQLHAELRWALLGLALSHLQQRKTDDIPTLWNNAQAAAHLPIAWADDPTITRRMAYDLQSRWRGPAGKVSSMQTH